MSTYDNCTLIIAGIATGLIVFKFAPTQSPTDPTLPPKSPSPDLIPTWAALVPAVLALSLFSLRSLFHG